MIFFILEFAAVFLLVLFMAFGLANSAVEQSLARASVDLDPAFVQQVLDQARRAIWSYAGGIAAMMLGRFLAARGKQDLRTHLVMPAVTLLTGLGLALHLGYAVHGPEASRFFFGPAFAQGVLWGGLLAGLIMAVPWDPAAWADRMRYPLGVAAVAVFGALLIFGEAPGTSGAKIRLFGIQPIEGAKILFVVFLAAVLGRQAEQLRYQRVRRGWFQMPRLKLLLPAIVLLIFLFGGLLVVRDLGPTLILALVFLAFYYVVTRSWAELFLVALTLPATFYYLVAARPAFLPGNVSTRLDMWLDPWRNGHSSGDQLAASLWAFAAGGFSGDGWGQAVIRYLPAGHTDLILAHLTEVAGFTGLAIYMLGFFALIFQGFWIARGNRTPERMLLAFGLTLLLFAQWLVIFCGSTGLLPLTGVVVPFLSFGKTGMVAFLAVVAVLVRLAVAGRPRAARDELFQVQRGIEWTMVTVLLATVVCALAAFNLAVVKRSEIAVQGVLALGADNSVFLRYDPRLREILRRIRRGEIHDRSGVVIAGTDEEGRRTYPLEAAIGTLLGPVDSRLVPPGWAVEGRLDPQLRGIRPSTDELAVWIEQREDRSDRILFTVDTHEYRDSDLARAKQMLTPGNKHFFTRLKVVDLEPLLYLRRLRGEARREAVDALVNDVPSRTASLTLDASLQRGAARILRDVVTRYRGQAGALAVLDVESGEVLARAQWPDYDPGRPATWRQKALERDPRFLGSYGPWRDKTGIGGLYQSGSIFKLVTAMAWMRSGLEVRGASCSARGRETFACTELDRQGPFFTLPDWSQAIHDSHPNPDGVIELTKALEVSCNVFFAQLGLKLGPGPIAALVADGLEVDNRDKIKPGDPGTRQLASTAFGQGAARMHVMEAARMVATVGSGGVYRRCPSTMVLGEPCEETRLFETPSLLEPVLAGMRRAVETGTARRMRKIEGVRVYAKTGTATDPGRRDEVPYGLRRGRIHKEHSWFVALAESSAAPACRAVQPGRLAVAVTVPRGGAGNGAAMEVAQGVLKVAKDLGFL